MSVELAAAILLIVVPVAFNIAFFELAPREFVGPNERDGWHLAGIIVPISYVAWSLWLILLGIFLIV